MGLQLIQLSGHINSICLKMFTSAEAAGLIYLCWYFSDVDAVPLRFWNQPLSRAQISTRDGESRAKRTRGGSEKQSGEKEGGAASRHQTLFGAVILLCFLNNKVSDMLGLQHNVQWREMRRSEHRKRRFAFLRFCSCGTVHERATDTKWGTKGAVWTEALSLTSPAL